jgi:hypothetical protein
VAGGPGEDLCLGGPGADEITGCEPSTQQRAAPATGTAESGGSYDYKARSRQHRSWRLRSFRRERAVRRMGEFLRQLKDKEAIKSPDDTTRQLRRSASLVNWVGRVVDRRCEKRRRHMSAVRAVFLQSVERYQFRLMAFAISDEIDRLRWTAP